jgi:glutamine amidotransferase-like uncharacterized protein
MFKNTHAHSIIFCGLKIAVLALVFDCQAAETKPIRVAIFMDKGSARGQGGPNMTAQLEKLSDMKVTHVDGEKIANGALKDFEVAVFPGGYAGQQSKALGKKGAEEVRNFVRNGGGYVGICAGAYLACSGTNQDCKNTLGILNTTSAVKWERGKAKVDVELTPIGQQAKILPGKMQKVTYHNGPIFTPTEDKERPAFEVLAYYRSEVSNRGSEKGTMVNQPAIVTSTYGQGRVLACSPHPEQTEGMESFIEHAVRWAAEKESKEESDLSKLNGKSKSSTASAGDNPQ